MIIMVGRAHWARQSELRIDFESIFAVKDIAGMKMFFVEQDRFRDYDAFESVEMSFNYLNNADFV